MLDQLLGTVLFLLGLSGSVKGESTPSASASESALSSVTTTLSNVLNPASSSSPSVSITDMKSYKALVSQKNQERQKTWEKNMQTFQQGANAITNNTKRTSMMEFQNQLTVLKQSRISVMEHELDALQSAVDGMGKGVGTASGTLTTKLIPDAQTAIAKAASLLYAFLEKPDTMTFSSGEKNIKADAQKIRKQMETDMKAIVAAITDAQKKVKAAYDEYKKVTKKTLTISVSGDSFGIGGTRGGTP